MFDRPCQNKTTRASRAPFHRLALLLAVCGFTAAVPVAAQPSPCGADADMTPTCLEACVVCDINGFSGINSDPDPGEAPPGFCTTTAHHMQWIAFVAGSEDLTITVKPTNCTTGFGLEVGIYESLDCETFALVSNCDGEILPGQTGTFQNITPLVIGQYYYFVMDGNNGDICQYTIQVLEGSTLVPPLPPAEAVQGPSVVCRDSTALFGIPPVTGANFYDWTLDGMPVGTGSSAAISFPDPGIHQLCVTAYNVCDTVLPACRQVRVVAPQVTDLTVGLCAGDCVEVGGSDFCQPGTYTIPLQGYLGCDSTIQLTVEVLPAVETDISAFICDTDSLLVGEDWYQPPGQYQAVLTSENGCDSVIHLDLQAVICEITGSALASPVSCQGGTDGSLTFQVLQGTPPFTYSWERLGGSPTGTGNLAATGIPVGLTGLPAGVYLIAVQDTFGNDVVLNTLVTAPPALAIQLTGSDYQGYGIRCAGGADGTVSAQVSGGTPGYSFLWEDGRQLAAIDQLTAGNHTLTVTDANGCTAIAGLSLQSPPPLRLSAAFTPPDCSGTNSGQLEILSAEGGIAPYQYGLNGLATGPATLFEGLGAGTYTLVVTDANGCTADSTGTLQGIQIPILQIPSPIELVLGYSTLLPASLNLLPVSSQWSPEQALSCADCLSPEASPLESTWYTLTVRSADGCTATDSTLVQIIKVRDVFPPNVFSPNGDGINDRFTLFGDRGLRRIISLQVFSRWGEWVFEGLELPPNDPTYGWDGTFRGKPMMPGVYLWTAEVEFLDGVVQRIKGETTLVR